MKQLICAHCGAAFECARKKKYCGTTECNVSRQRAYQAKSDAKKRAAAVPYAGRCLYCETEFVSLVRKKYCSYKCKDKYSRKSRTAAQKTKRNLVSRSYENTPARQAWRREWRKKYKRQRMDDPKYVLDKRLSEQMRSMLRGGKRGKRWVEMAPFTIDELKAHIERQFVKGMGWGNMDRWHIDHIVPKSSFNYESPECEGFKSAWALTNLRPLWAEDNIKKGRSVVNLL